MLYIWVSLLVVAQVGKGKIVRVSGIKNQGPTATVLLRGSNKLVMEEAERSLHDALCVVRCLVRKQFLIPGGAAPEIELNVQLSRWAKSLVVRYFLLCLFLHSGFDILYLIVSCYLRDHLCYMSFISGSLCPFLLFQQDAKHNLRFHKTLWSL